VYGAKMLIVAPLLIACILVVVSISVFASRGKLHMPAYVGIAFLGFAFSLLFGRLAGIKDIHGSAAAVALSIVCYLCIATTVGSIVALFFYRQPPEI
jgi:hypothetical protein